MSDIITSETRAAYWSSVYGIADEILAEHYGDDDAINDAVHEHVDGSGWIIYTGKQLAVLLLTQNDPDGEDVASMSGGSWDSMQTVAAFLAMERDVYDDIRYKIDNADTECPDCGGDMDVTCPYCGGTGDSNIDGGCELCSGSGTVECERCEGTGEINPFKED